LIRRSSELNYGALYDDKDNDISRFEELYSELKQDAFAAAKASCFSSIAAANMKQIARIFAIVDLLGAQ